MTTPPPRHFCPRCRHGYAEPQAFCSECGGDMLRASALDLAQARDALGEVDGAGLAAAAVTMAAATTAPGGPVGGNPATARDRRINASDQAWLGRIVDGRYRVIEQVGRGGMGVVYKVEHLRMGKIAAMKVLHRDLADDPEVGLRFEREAAAVSRLDHPNTVSVFDFGAAGGALYLIMEFVRGADLGRLIDRDGPMPFARAAPLLIQILGALTEAHERGIIHRDLKPDNVLITRSTGGRDFAKVLDFGLAKMIGPGAAPDASDQAQIVGTPYFMAPEQIRGDEVDARTDVYSLGALMYRLLTGTHPFQAKTAIGVLTKHLTSELQPPSSRAPAAGLSPAIDEIVRRAMAKDPAQRWPSAAAMAGAIEQAYAELVGDSARLAAARWPGSGPGLRPPTVDGHQASELHLRRADIDEYERSLRRQRLLVAVGAGLVVVGLAAAIVWWTLLREPPARRHEREPNDTLALGTKIAPGRAVTGHLGRRRSPTDADVDFFTVARRGPGVVTVRLRAVPNLDLTLTLRDPGGRVLAVSDETAVGGGEVLHRRAVDGPVSIEVGQVMTGRWPIENVSDAYGLEVDVDVADGWEREPNGGATDASPLLPDQPVRGYLDTRDDLDVLRWDGPDGPVVVTLVVTGELPMRWRGPDEVEHGPGRTALSLRRGDLLGLRRADRGQDKRAVSVADGTWTLTVAAAPAR